MDLQGVRCEWCPPWAQEQQMISSLLMSSSCEWCPPWAQEQLIVVSDVEVFAVNGVRHVHKNS